MEKPQWDYIRQVLGVRQVLTPSDYQMVASTERISAKTLARPLVFFVAEKLGKDEEELLVKMARAIGVTGFTLVQSQADLSNYSFGHPSVIICFGTQLNQNQINHQFQVSSLKEMVGEGVQVQKNKKQTWAALKKAKALLDGANH